MLRRGDRIWQSLEWLSIMLGLVLLVAAQMLAIVLLLRADPSSALAVILVGCFALYWSYLYRLEPYMLDVSTAFILASFCLIVNALPVYALWALGRWQSLILVWGGLGQGALVLWKSRQREQRRARERFVVVVAYDEQGAPLSRGFVSACTNEGPLRPVRADTEGRADIPLSQERELVSLWWTLPDKERHGRDGLSAVTSEGAPAFVGELENRSTVEIERTAGGRWLSREPYRPYPEQVQVSVSRRVAHPAPRRRWPTSRRRQAPAAAFVYVPLPGALVVLQYSDSSYLYGKTRQNGRLTFPLRSPQTYIRVYAASPQRGAASALPLAEQAAALLQGPPLTDRRAKEGDVIERFGPGLVLLPDGQLSHFYG